jgi:hypothetical protein
LLTRQMIAQTLTAHPLSVTAGICAAAIFQSLLFFAFHDSVISISPRLFRGQPIVL